MENEFDFLSIGGVPIYCADVEARADIAELMTLYHSLTESDLIVGALPSTGQANKIYRVPNDPEQGKYSDYMYNAEALTTPVKLCTYDNAVSTEIDPEGSNLPTEQAVANYVGGLLKDYANVAGSYDTLYAGLAGNIKDDKSMSISKRLQTTADGEEVGDGMIRVNTVEGQGFSMNQLYDTKAGGSSVVNEQAQLAYLYGNVVNRKTVAYSNPVSFFCMERLGVNVAKGISTPANLSSYINGWNQRIKNGDFADGTTGWAAYGNGSISASNGVLTLTSTQQGSGFHQSLFYNYGHAAILVADVKLGKSSNYVAFSVGGAKKSAFENTTDWQRVMTRLNVGSARYFGIINDSTDDWGDVQVKNFMFFDLTDMGIESQINSVDDFVAWCTDNNIDLSTYHPYRLGIPVNNHKWIPELTDENKASYNGMHMAVMSYDNVISSDGANSPTYSSDFFLCGVAAASQRAVVDMAQCFCLDRSGSEGVRLAEPYRSWTVDDMVSALSSAGVLADGDIPANKGKLYGTKFIKMRAEKTKNLCRVTGTTGVADIPAYDYEENSRKVALSGAGTTTDGNITFTDVLGNVFSASALGITSEGSGETERRVVTVPRDGRINIANADASTCVWLVWDGSEDETGLVDNEVTEKTLEVARIYGHRIIAGVPSDTAEKIWSDGTMKGLPGKSDMILLSEDEAVVNVKELDLYEQTWLYQQYTDVKNNYFRASASYEDVYRNEGEWVSLVESFANAPSEANGSVISYYGERSAQVSERQGLSVKDSRYNNIDDFKASVNGLKAWVELSPGYAVYYSGLLYDTSVSGDGSQLVPLSESVLNMPVCNWSTQAQPIASDGSEGTTAKITAVYASNLKEDIKTLKDTAVTTDAMEKTCQNLLNFLTAQGVIPQSETFPDGTVDKALNFQTV